MLFRNVLSLVFVITGLLGVFGVSQNSDSGILSLRGGEISPLCDSSCVEYGFQFKECLHATEEGACHNRICVVWTYTFADCSGVTLDGPEDCLSEMDPDAVRVSSEILINVAAQLDCDDPGGLSPVPDVPVASFCNGIGLNSGKCFIDSCEGPEGGMADPRLGREVCVHAGS